MSRRLTYEIGATWSSEVNTDVKLNVSVGNTHFRIDLFTTNFEANPKLLKEYLLHVEHSDPTYIPPLPEEPDGEVEFVDPLKSSTTGLQNLLLNSFVVGEKLVPVLRDVNVDARQVGVLLPASKPLNKSLPIYRPSQIHVRHREDAVALPTFPSKVYINANDVCFFKQLLAGDVGMAVTELATYAKIHAAELGEDVRVSRLLGVVQDEAATRILGLLLSYIDCENQTLFCATRAGESMLHEKWMRQITHSVNELHARQIVWGDAKPDNILIDGNGDAYLVDFGGGYTNGWVDKEFVNTRVGDLQGLERIKAYLAELSV